MFSSATDSKQHLALDFKSSFSTIAKTLTVESKTEKAALSIEEKFDAMDQEAEEMIQAMSVSDRKLALEKILAEKPDATITDEEQETLLQRMTQQERDEAVNKILAAEERIDIEKLIKIEARYSFKLTKDTHTTIYTLDSKDKNFFFNNKRIIKIRLFWQEYDRDEFSPIIDINHVELTSVDRKKILLPIDWDSFLTLRKIEYNIDVEQAFRNKGRTALPWKICASEIMANFDEFYSALHIVLAQYLVNKLKEEKVNCVKLFAFGTGDGNDITTALKALMNHHILATGIGFDFHKESIALAQKKQAEQKISLPCLFKEGNTENLLNLVTAEKSNAIFSKQTGKSKTVIMFCGALTRRVLNSTIDGLAVIQQAHRCSDLVFSTGLEETLFTNTIAKRCGWHSQILSIHPPERMKRSLYILKKPTLLERKESLKKKLQKKPEVLNLAMSADPVGDLRLLKDSDTTKVRVINLSWAYLLESDIEILMKENLLQKFPNVTIQYNSYSKNIASIKATPSSSFTLEFISSPDESEVPEVTDEFVARHGLKRG